MHQVIIGDNRYGTPMPHKSHLIRLVDSEFVTASGSNFEGQPFFERCFDLFDSHFFTNLAEILCFCTKIRDAPEIPFCVPP